MKVSREPSGGHDGAPKRYPTWPTSWELEPSTFITETTASGDASPLAGTLALSRLAHPQIDLVRLPQPIEQHPMELAPDACLLPVAQPSPTGHSAATAHLQRQQLPRNAALQDEDDAGQGGADLNVLNLPFARGSVERFTPDLFVVERARY